MTMTNAEFRALRDYLGFSAQWCAHQFRVSDRAIRKWDSGEAPVPPGVADEFRQISESTDRYIDQVCATLENTSGLRIFEYPRTIAARNEMTPANHFPLTWWRMVAARVHIRTAATLEFINAEGGDEE